MDDLISARLAELRAAAEARAERIHRRTLDLEARRRELYERMERRSAVLAAAVPPDPGSSDLD